VSVQDLGFSAIVVTYNTGAILDTCLDALLSSPLCRQLIVVNNGNPSHMVQRLRSLSATHAELSLIDGHGNIGFGRGCNLGAEHASWPYLVFVNPDCIVDGATLPAFSDTLGDYPTALLGGALRNEDGSEQRGGRRGELTLLSALISFLGLGRQGADAGLWRDFNREGEVAPTDCVPMPTLSGALLAMSRDSFERLEGFDASYFLHVEDIDLCKRARDLGLPVLYVPRATAIHVSSTSATSSWVIVWAKIMSFQHYFWTHAKGLGGRLALVFVMPFLAVALMVRALFVAKR
jgi:N-acetylglucosaminyl-diphospho-decaprenol L-rhamnosyltransferase